MGSIELMELKLTTAKSMVFKEVFILLLNFEQHGWQCRARGRYKRQGRVHIANEPQKFWKDKDYLEQIKLEENR